MGDKIKNGLALVTVSTIIRNVVGVAQISVLTRLLAKSDFGIIALAGLFVNFTILFTDMGISAGILHYQRITKNEYSSLYIFNLFFGIILSVCLYLLSPLIVRSYNSQVLVEVIQLLCLSILLNSIGNQQRIVCQKQKKFLRLSVIEIIASLITFIVAISTAYLGYGVFSLAYSTLAGVFLNNVLHLLFGVVIDNSLSLHFRFFEIKKYLRIGIFSVGAQILDFFTRELDVIIVSSTLGLDFLGVYNVSKRITLSIYGFVTPIVSKIFTPVLAEVNNNKDRLYYGFTKLISSISLISLPLFMLISAFSPTVIYIIFGSEFVEGAPIQSVFAFMFGINCFLSTAGSLQIATARTDIGLVWTIFSICATTLVFYVSSRFGITCFLIGIVFRSVIDVIFIWLFQFKKMLGISFCKYIRLFLYPLCVCILLSIPFWMFFYEPNLILTIAGTMFFIVAYILILWNSSYKGELQYLIKKTIYND